MQQLRWKIILFCVKHSNTYLNIHHIIKQSLKNKNTPKVFCIGDVKTGTSSLHKALNILGYRTVRIFKWGEIFNRKFDIYLEYLEELRLQQWKPYINKIKKFNYDAYVDFPMGHDDVYKAVDKTFPDSKFILTVRDSKSFAKSFENYFKGSPWEIKKPRDLEKRVKEFKNHNKEVIEYFKNQPSKLLILNILKNEGWEELCKFLNKPIPTKPFPHKNIGKYKRK